MNTKAPLNSIADLPSHAKVVFFDGACVFCNKAVQLIYRNDKKKTFYFAHLQSAVFNSILSLEGGDSQTSNSIYLSDGVSVYSHSTAVLKIAKELDWPFPILYGLVVLPRMVRDWFYRIIAANRYKWFGKYDQCATPNEGLQERFLGDYVHTV